MVGKGLTDQENELLLEIKYKQEGALAWAWEEQGRVQPEVAPPQHMQIVEHKAWQAARFKVPQALQETVNDMLKK